MFPKCILIRLIYCPTAFLRYISRNETNLYQIPLTQFILLKQFVRARNGTRAVKSYLAILMCECLNTISRGHVLNGAIIRASQFHYMYGFFFMIFAIITWSVDTGRGRIRYQTGLSSLFQSHQAQLYIERKRLLM